MKVITRILLSLVVALMLCIGTVPAKAGTPKRVMINVTTDDVNRAAMAISFAHAMMKNEGLEGTLFFSVTGVHLVDKDKPSPIYPTGSSIADMLNAFMKDGGMVIACPMCMKNVGGMTNASLMDGVKAQKGMGVKAAVAPDTLVMTY